MNVRVRRAYSFFSLLLLGLLLTGCRAKEPTRWDQAQQESRGKPAVSKQAEAGGSFNKFFPKPGNGFDIVFKQEKAGFAQASLKQGGQEVATLSISDTISNPDAVTKFQNSTQNLGGYPAVAVGNMGTAALIANRFQVQVRSTSSAFTRVEREAWIQKFDLAGLSQLK